MQILNSNIKILQSKKTIEFPFHNIHFYNENLYSFICSSIWESMNRRETVLAFIRETFQRPLTLKVSVSSFFEHIHVQKKKVQF